MKANLYVGTALTAVAMAAAYAFVSPGAPLAADGPSRLDEQAVSFHGRGCAGLKMKQSSHSAARV
jgi:hypothetical protein